MSFIDVETSAEAIQEDEELIEAVNEIVETAATAIYTDIKNDVSDVVYEIQYWVDFFFPFLNEWKHNPGQVWIDLQRLGLALVLFLISFILLAPSRRWSEQTSSSRDPQRDSAWMSKSSWFSFGVVGRFFLPFLGGHAKGSNEEAKQRPRPTMERSRSTSSLAVDRGMHPIKFLSSASYEARAEAETEEEKFAKRWPTILKTRYAILVLPPECKRVEKPKRAKREADSAQSKRRKEDDSDGKETDEENPAQRLVNYTRQFLHLMMSFFRYDYIGAGRTLIEWVETWLRNQRNRKLEVDPVADDESDAGVVRRLSFGSQASESSASRKPPAKAHSTKVKMRGKRDSILKRARDEEETSTSRTDAYGTIEEKLETPTIPSSPARDGEEKKETSGSDLYTESSSTTLVPPATPLSTNARKRADTLYGTPLLDEPAETDSRDSDPQAAAVAINQRSSMNGASKAKDALESYRNAGIRGKSLHTGALSPVSSLGLNHVEYEMSSSQDGRSGGVHAPLHTLPDLPILPLMKKDSERSESVGSAYYFETASTRESLKQMAVEVPVPDKNGYIVGDDFLPGSGWTPLLVFVNSRSGPQQGHLLITQLRGLLNPMQVWDLADGGPEEILESFSQSLTRMRILVCGGDGTVSWIVSTIEKMKLHKWPPIAILPLGTGNDLARIHGWGGGYNNESLTGILEQVAESYISWLDRWEMTVEDKRGRIKDKKAFFNYLGVGADAQAALQVHLLRESRPQLFFSRVVNKAWYGVFGAEDIVKATSVNVPNEITLIADGVEVPLPADSQGIILLNIDSYAGGCALWSQGTKATTKKAANDTYESTFGEIPMTRSRSLDMINKLKAKDGQSFKDASQLDRVDSVEDFSILSEEEEFERVTACERPSSCQDGFLDVVSIRGAFHLGQIRVGLSNAQKLCQCREAKIIIKRKVSVQIDGEPWRQNLCTLHVKGKKDAAIMLHRSAHDSNGVETEMANLLDWAEDRNLINDKVHAALMKEFSRRIESKTRQRREKYHRATSFSLKRAISSTGNLGLSKSSTPMD